MAYMSTGLVCVAFRRIGAFDFKTNTGEALSALPPSSDTTSRWGTMGCGDWGGVGWEVTVSCFSRSCSALLGLHGGASDDRPLGRFLVAPLRISLGVYSEYIL